MIQSELDMPFPSTLPPSSPSSTSSSSSSISPTLSSSPLFSSFANPLLSNASTQLTPQDVYMWLALWLDQCPWSSSPKMGCVLVNSNLDQVVKLECTMDGLLATQKALIQFPWHGQGPFTLYCSRFPSTVCCKLMVQCGIQRCFYFPASLTPLTESPLEQYQAVIKLVQNSNLAFTLYIPQWLTPLSTTITTPSLPLPSYSSSIVPTTTNTKTMAPTLSSSIRPLTSSSSSVIPSFDPKKGLFENKKISNNNNNSNNTNTTTTTTTTTTNHNNNNNNNEDGYLNLPSSFTSSHSNEKMSTEQTGVFSFEFPSIDPFYFNPRSTSDDTFHTWIQRFEVEFMAFQQVVKHYFQMTPHFVTPSSSSSSSWQGAWTVEDRQHMYHGLVLAHILSRRTDDPKIGVGAVLVTNMPRGYLSAGYNRFFNCPSPYAFPRLGADELHHASQEVKYPFTIHAEQHCCLYTSPFLSQPLLPMFRDLMSSFAVPVWSFITTKYPCDECAPLMKALNVHRVITVQRRPRTRGVATNRGFTPSSTTTTTTTTTSSVPSEVVVSSSSTVVHDFTNPMASSLVVCPNQDDINTMDVTGVHAHRGLTYTKLETLFSSIVLLE